MSMTREQRKYWRKSAICFTLVIILCAGIVYGVCHLVNVAM